MEKTSEQRWEALWSELDREQRVVCIHAAKKFQPLGWSRLFAINSALDMRGVVHYVDLGVGEDGKVIGRVVEEPQQQEQVERVVDEMLVVLEKNGAVEVGTCGEFARDFLETHEEELMKMQEAFRSGKPGDVDQFLFHQRDMALAALSKPEFGARVAYRMREDFGEFVLGKEWDSRFGNKINGN